MGNYASTAQLTARFESSADLAFLTDSEDTGVADTDVLTECINGAEGEIDGYIGMRYDVPVDVSGTDDQINGLMLSMTLDMAIWNLLKRFTTPPANVEKSYDDRVKFLIGVAAGTIMLPSGTPLTSTTVNAPGASWGIAGESVSGTSQRVFSRADMENL